MGRTITVSGMGCEGCEETVEDALRSVPGVTSVDVDHTTDSATVGGDVDRDAITRAIRNAGYEASI